MISAWLGTLLAVDPTFQSVVSVTPPDTAEEKYDVVTCPIGYRAFSGGVSVTGADTGQILLQSGPDDGWVAPTSWRAHMRHDARAPNDPWGMEVSVLCLREDIDMGLSRRFQTISAVTGQRDVEATATCPPGNRMISGGATAEGDLDGWGLATDSPVSGWSWKGMLMTTDPANPPTWDVDLTVGVVCLSRPVWNQVISLRTTSTSGPVKPMTSLACTPGTTAISGGGLTIPMRVGATLTSTAPDDPHGGALGWEATAQALDGVAMGFGLTSAVVCLR